jgi:signal transduction histidine kinase
MKYDILKGVPLFADLSKEDLERLCEGAEEVHLPAGQELFAEGSPGDRAYVTTGGQIEVVKASSGREVLLAVREAGEVIGEMALLEETPRMATVRARKESTLLAISKEQIDALLATSPSAVRAMFYTILSRWRSTESMLRQSERMAQLGTLTAGVAHELNNPAAAVKRGADQFRDAVSRHVGAQAAVACLDLGPAEAEALRELTEHALEAAAHPLDLDTLAQSDRETEMEDLLDRWGVPDAWEIAPALASLGQDADEISSSMAPFARERLPAILGSVSAAYALHTLLAEIGHGASRISEVVKALKSYSYLDQAPVLPVDLHEGLDSTLMILRNKLRAGISVRREYGGDVPRIQGYGSELNQVWTNLIDNAADAMDGEGVITLRTRPDGDGVMVEIEDNGPGIPPEIQTRIFDPFFTTKEPGKGTGLGLDICYNIVVYKHHGEIKVVSEPGSTRFQVWLPVDFDAR